MKPTFIFLPALLLTACANKLVVSKVPTTKTMSADVVAFTLPRTVVQVQVSMTRKEKKPGTYVEWIDLFYPNLAQDAVKKNSIGYSISKSTLSLVAEPDPTMSFQIPIKRNLWEQVWQDRSGHIDRDPSGLIKGGDIALTNNAPDILMSTVSLASGAVNRTVLAAPIGGAGFIPSTAETPVSKCEEIEITDEESTLLRNLSNASLEDDPPNAFNDDRILFCRLRSINISKAPPQRYVDAVGDGGVKNARSLRRAMKAYRYIRELAQKAGTVSEVTSAPKDMQDLLQKLFQDSVQQNFTGTSSSEDWQPTFVVRPIRTASTETKSYALFSYNSKAGEVVLDSTQSAEGIQIAPDFAPDSKTTPESAVRHVSLELACAPGTAGNATGVCEDLAAAITGAVKDATGSRGFPYRQPAVRIAKVIDTDGKDPAESGRATIAIAQFGPLLTLPASLGGFSSTYTFQIDQATGNLTTIQFGGKSGLTKSTIDSASSLVNGTIDARSAQLKAIQDQADKAAQRSSVAGELARRKALLQDQADYLAACVSAGITCPILVGPDGRALTPHQ